MIQSLQKQLSEKDKLIYDNNQTNERLKKPVEEVAKQVRG
jgi:hypothetical protein